VQWTILPIALCPSYLNPIGVVVGQTDFTLDIAIGTKERGTQNVISSHSFSDLVNECKHMHIGTAGVLHETIRTQLRGLISKGRSHVILMTLRLPTRHYV
jgi:hypothetical protein